LLLGDSGGGFFVRHNGIFYLKGIVSSSLIDRSTFSCDITAYALFTNVLKFIEWIADPSGDHQKCGVMSKSAGLVQGGELSSRDQFPWEVSVLLFKHKAYQFLGSGSLISTRHVLTKAGSVASVRRNKTFAELPINRLRLIAGSVNASQAIGSGALQIDSKEIASISIHPKARDGLLQVAAVAVVALKHSIHKSDFVFPVCLLSEDSHDHQIYGVGYGLDESGKASGVRKHTAMMIKDQQYCEKDWSELLPLGDESKFFCAKGNGNDTTCKMDTFAYTKINGLWFIKGLRSMNYETDGKTCDPSTVLYEDAAFYWQWIKLQI